MPTTAAALTALPECRSSLLAARPGRADGGDPPGRAPGPTVPASLADRISDALGHLHRLVRVLDNELDELAYRASHYAHTIKEQEKTRRTHMTASDNDQPSPKRWRLVPIPVLTGVLAVIGALVLAVFLSGCRGPSKGPGPTASSPSAAPSTGPTYRVTATVPVGKRPQAVAVDPSTHTVYVINHGDSTVAVIDGSTHTVTATVPVGNDLGAVAVDPGTHTVYVATRDPELAKHDTQPPSRSGRVSVIDGSTHTVTATIPIGKSPDGLAVDPGTHTVYVPKYADDTVAVIDGSTHTVTATVPNGRAELGHWVAVDPVTHTVYVTNFNDKTMSVIESR